MQDYKLISILALIVFSILPNATLSAVSSPSQGNSVLSKRLIVKLKSSHLPSSMNKAQIAAELSLPLSIQQMSQIQSAAGAALMDSHAMPNGAHILVLPGSASQQMLDQAITNIGRLPEVEYVEEDQVMTIQITPLDPNYNLLWGLKPASTVTSPSPGATGSYGADFETAWDTSTGTSIIVAVVDTGYTSMRILLAICLDIPLFPIAG